MAIAETLGGGDGPAAIQRFVRWMNDKVTSLGLGKTTFANPHGLESQGYNLSTAHDMAHIARAYMSEPVLATIARSEGVKTGFEGQAGRCLAASAVRGGERLVAVVLNSDLTVTDASKLLDYGFNNYAYLAHNAALNPVLGQMAGAGLAVHVPRPSAPEVLLAPSELSS